jgi:uncharacterized protein HemX
MNNQLPTSAMNQYLLRKFTAPLQRQREMARTGMLVSAAPNAPTSVTSVTTTGDPSQMEGSKTSNHLLYYAIGAGIVVAGVYLIKAHQTKKQEQALARLEQLKQKTRKAMQNNPGIIQRPTPGSLVLRDIHL